MVTLLSWHVVLCSRISSVGTLSTEKDRVKKDSTQNEASLHGRDRRSPRRDSPGSRRRPLLLVIPRSDERPGGAAAASQRNHQGSPARRRDRRLTSGQF